MEAIGEGGEGAKEAKEAMATKGTEVVSQSLNWLFGYQGYSQGKQG